MTDLDPEVKEIYANLFMYRDAPARQKWLKRRRKSWEAVENEMFTDQEKEELRKEGMIPLVINKLVKGVQGASAVATDSKPEIKYYPAGGDGDLYVAELLTRGYSYVWDQNLGGDVAYDVVEENKIGGWGVFHAHFNPARGAFGKIEIEEYNPEWVYFSPYSRKRDWSDTHVIIAIPRTKKYLREKYRLNDKDFEGVPQKLGDMSETHGYEGRDDYAEALKHDRDERLPEKMEHPVYYEIEAWMLRTFHEKWMVRYDDSDEPVFEKIPDADEEDPIKIAESKGGVFTPKTIQRRVQYIIVGNRKIYRHVNPLGTDIEGDPIFSIIPVSHYRTRNAYSMSPTNYAMDLNREKNKRRAQFIHMTSHNANQPIISQRGTLTWDKPPSKPGAQGQVDENAAFPPYRLPGGTLDATRFIELESKADSEIDDIYDMHDVMRGKIPKGTDPSGRVVLALQDMGGVMSRPFMRRLESGFIRLGRVLGVLMLRHFPRQVWERFVEQDELNDPTVVDEETGMTVGDRWRQALDRIRPLGSEKPNVDILWFDVRCRAGSSMPTNRMAKAMLAIEYVQNGIYDAEAALEYVDDPKKEAIAARMREKEQQALQAKLLGGK